MKSSILDLGDVGARPSLDAAMRGYIGLSRVRAAHNLLLAQPFSPLLFSQGPQPFPSALMEVLRGNVQCAEVSAKMKEARDSKKGYQTVKKYALEVFRMSRPSTDESICGLCDRRVVRRSL